MKIIKHIIAILLYVVVISTAAAIGDSGTVAAIWATHFEKMAKMIDQLDSAYKMIEVQYQQYRQLVDQAKSIDWSKYNLSEFKIKDFTSPAEAIRAQLDLVDQIKGQINSNFMSVNGHSYSLADVCGLNGEQKSMKNFFIDGVKEAKTRKNNFVKALTANLNEKERAYIREKFGVDADVYAVSKAQEKSLKEQTAEVSNAASELTDKKKEEYFAKLTKILDEVVDGDEITPTKILQAIVLQNERTKEMMLTFNKDVNNIGDLLSKQILADVAKENHSQALRTEREKIVNIVSNDEKVVRTLKNSVSQGDMPLNR